MIEENQAMESRKMIEENQTMENRKMIEENQTMESMEDYAAELERSFRSVEVGDIMKGIIIAITETELILDLNFYAQGIVPLNEVTEDPTFLAEEKFTIGEEVKATIIKSDDGNGNIILSMKEANQLLAWDQLVLALNEKKVFKLHITAAVNGGVIVYPLGVRGFIPASQMELTYVEDLESYVGKDIDAVVTTVDKEKQKLVLSAKQVLLDGQREERSNRISHMVPGSILEGTVESIMPYGAFIGLGEGLSGLLHISRISNKRLKSPAEVLSVGQKVKVKLIDTKDNKLSLSMKELEESMEEIDSLESFDYKEEGNATTTLGDLFKNIKL